MGVLIEIPHRQGKRIRVSAAGRRDSLQRETAQAIAQEDADGRTNCLMDAFSPNFLTSLPFPDRMEATVVKCLLK